MNDFDIDPADATFEHRFAKNLIRFVLHEYMLGLHWIPTGIFAEKEHDSPFTPQFRNAVVNKLENNGWMYHRLYDLYFPNKAIVAERHFDVCKAYKDSLVRHAFAKDYFVAFCAFAAQCAGLSYLYGAYDAPYETYMLIKTAIRELKRLGKINDDFWQEFGCGIGFQAAKM